MKFDFEKEAFVNGLQEMVQDYGRMILNDDKKCYSLWLDYAPQLSEEGELLKVFLELGLGKQAVELKKGNTEEQAAWKKQAIENMVRAGQLQKDAECLVEAVLAALGWGEEQIQTPRVMPKEEESKPVPTQVTATNSMKWYEVKKKLKENYLLEKLFESERGKYSIYLLAGVRLIAESNDSQLIEEVGEPFYHPITEKDALTLVEHSKNGSDYQLFRNALDNASRLYTYGELSLEEIMKIKEEVERGERERLVSEECIRTLKEGAIASMQKLVEKYGIPPQFSTAKYWECVVACFCTLIGAPYWLVGRPLPALLCIAINLPAYSTFHPLLLGLSSMSMIVTFFIVFGGRLKDKKGLYVIPEADKKRIMSYYNQMEKYKKELG